MKILIVHTAYRQRGGEDSVLAAELQLLKGTGHRVCEYLRDNNEISGSGILANATLVPRAIWAWDSCRQLKVLLKKEKPDLAHFHNTFPLISPAAYYACADANVPVIQRIPNYRLMCPGSTFFRDGHVCEDCLGKTFPWAGIVHACYRGSPAASATVAAVLGVHRALQTWTTKVNAFIAPSEFVKEKFIQGGFQAGKIFVKPNFVSPDPCPNGSAKLGSCGEHAVFVGRLSEEKGVRTLLAAWRRLGGQIPLRIVGDGPLRAELEASAKNLTKVSFEGFLGRKEVFDILGRARFLVLPSECYETFGCVIAESFAFGVPAIVSRLAGPQEIVENNVTGLHFNPGDADDLAAKVQWAWAHPGEIQAMGRSARTEYETKYSAERNYRLLMEIYECVLAGKPQHSIQAGEETSEPATSYLGTGTTRL